MGDTGEGLVDAEARIQERAEELERERRERTQSRSIDAGALRELESLKLARSEMQRQFDATSDERRRTSIRAALDELDRRIAGARSAAKTKEQP